MSREPQPELDLGLDPVPIENPKIDLSIRPAGATPLSPAQVEFNKRLKALEKARTAHENKRKRLDKDLATCREVLMPLVEKLNRVQHQLLLGTVERSRKLKLSRRRREALDDLMLCKADELLGDPTGLGEEERREVEALIDELDPERPEGDELEKELVREEFEELRELLESVAAEAGVELDLSGLDPNGDPEEFEREFEERLAAANPGLRDAALGGGPRPKTKCKRKPTKAALERERLKQEAEEAKKRDFKTLYKQLAKVLHPDLETDPELKAHKHAWMQRLTTAQAAGDLREMLAIEIEWLGEESGNLAQAADDKLKVYAMVLKEQAAELRERTRFLFREPEYGPLHRFIAPFSDRFVPSRIRADLLDEIERHEAMLDILNRGATPARRMLNDWADHHADSFEW